MPQISDYLYRKASARKIPLGAGFELSPVCNFACKMCFLRKTAAQVKAEGKRVREWTEWLELAEACRSEGTLFLLLTGGEPFLYPHFKELYLKLHEMGFILSIITKVTLIDERAMDWLKGAAPSRVNVTLYGASPETYGRLCGHLEGYERAVRAIRMLKEAGIPVVINASMIPENACDLEEIQAFGKELGVNTRIATYMFPPVRRDREKSDSRFSPDEAAQMFLRKMRCLLTGEDYRTEIRKQLKEAEKEPPTEPADWGNSQEYMRCRAGRSSFWVSWDGTMTACGMTPFPVRVQPFERPFRDCWLELTDQVRNTPVLRECAGCPRRSVCNPCVAMMYAETGEVNCRAPYLCEMAEKIIENIKCELKEGNPHGKEA